MRKAILLFCFLSLYARSQAQVVFELSFPLPTNAKITCNALICWLEDGSGFARLNWTDAQGLKMGDYTLNTANPGVISYQDHTGLYFIQELQLIRSVYGKIDEAIDDIPVWTNGYPTGPGKFVPVRSADSSFLASRIREISPAYLTTGTLLRYFTQAELGTEKKSFTPEELQALRFRGLPVIHGILLIDDKDSSIGKTCETDLRRVNAFFRKASSLLRLSYKPLQLKSNDFSVKSLLAAIASLQTGPNDMIVFYYSGHGFHYRNDEHHSFPEMRLLHQDARRKKELRENSVNTEEIFNRLRLKNPRLLLTISDCCNSYVEMPRFEDTTEVRLMKFPKQRDWKLSTVYRLLVQERGHFIVSATQKGQLAGSNSQSGGFFTQALFFTCLERGLLSRKNTLSGWSEVFEKTKGFATNRAATFQCPDIGCETAARARGAKKNCPYITCGQDMIMKKINR